ncbi:glycosyltransferase family 2 protein [uncultured Clostridium sp.]|uniref:glycosyltransferase family 2 protein n=1 Tax=uncultured Clostridium sp. TaxID=59620 RepID=UPI0025F159CA|nr:glycosyltransferase family 2 protein [uncultured Clostridium sp.]
MRNIAAVIITYNTGNEFSKNVLSLKKHVGEVIVVDNGSNKETLSMLRGLKEEITLIELNENKGIAYALNRGIEYAVNNDFQWVLTLDHDSTVSDSMISNMLSVYNSIDESEKEKIVMLTPKHVEEKQMDVVSKSQENKWEYVLTEITSGALTKADFYKNELYDEKLFIDLVDHDYCLRINSMGYKIIRVNSAILIHNLGESIQKKILGITITPTNHSALRRYYMSRNRKYIWNKYRGTFKEWVIKDKIRFLNEIVKIIAFEDEKLNKLKMIKLGLNDYKDKKWGCYFNHHSK